MLYGRPPQSWRSAGLILLAVLVLCGAGAVIISLRIDRDGGAVWATGVPAEPSGPAPPSPSPSPTPSATPEPSVSSPAPVRPTSRPVTRRPSSPSPRPTAPRSPSPAVPSAGPSAEPVQLGGTCSPEGSEGRTAFGVRVFCRAGFLGGQPRWRLL
ncbi:hypothetical protein [Actinoplanes couchii]|uniref:hypothetical protein n=1 Tax=Actinoplanes couchii TaxID=403638 RepID=UPI00194212A3|nr:hypothetical protein [Actinoplanes couchii]MDR6317148.1 hypothetical protein [Actinoplanes couchii]